MNKWQMALYCVAALLWPGENARFGNQRSFLPGKGVLNAIPEILGHPTTETPVGILRITTEDDSMTVTSKPEQSDNSPAPQGIPEHPPDDQSFPSNRLDYPHGPYPPDVSSHLDGEDLPLDDIFVSNNPSISSDHPNEPSYPLDDTSHGGGSNYPPDGPMYPPDNPSFPAAPDRPNHKIIHYAALPSHLAVVPLPLDNSNNELKFNVSWQAGVGPPATEYSLEVGSVTDTEACQSPMCYDYNIPGESSLWMIPVVSSPVAESCAVRPGCAYRLRLIAHPWDGHTSAKLYVELDDCVAGVCSCGHAPYLPSPRVHAQTITVEEELFANITWSLPRPTYPHRLPPGLYKKNYIVSIGKQMVSNAHPSPWFANTVTRQVDTDGPVADGDELRWILLPIDERSDKRDKRIRKKAPDVRMLARVRVVDDRGCFGPDGNATVHNPAVEGKSSWGTYVLWAVFGGACTLAMAAIVAVSTRLAKHILNVFRPPGSTAPLDTLRRRPAWFPLQIRTIIRVCR